MAGISFGSPDRRVWSGQGFLKECMAAILAVALALGALPVRALGLGELQVDSNLNEPFRGRIDLLSVDTGAAIRDASVGLAGAEVFEEAQVAYPPVLERLRFHLSHPRDAEPYIRVSSTGPIGDPHLHFIVEMRAGEARLLRHYIVLLDPPGPYKDRLASSLDTESAPVTTEASTSTERTYGPVRYAETLWSIAAKLRPDRSVSIQQMVFALQRANPRAFVGGDVNGLMSGAVLRVPGLEEIRATGTRDVVVEARRRENADTDAGDEVPAPGDERDSADLDDDGADASSEHAEASRPAESPVVEAEPEAQEENRRLRERIAVLERDLNDMLRLVDESAKPTDAGMSMSEEPAEDRSSVQPPEPSDSEGDPSGAAVAVEASKPDAVVVGDAPMDTGPQEIFLGLPSVDRRPGGMAVPEVVVSSKTDERALEISDSLPTPTLNKEVVIEEREALKPEERAQPMESEPVVSPRWPPSESSPKPSDGTLSSILEDPVVTGGGFVGLVALLAWIVVVLRRRNRRRAEEARRGGFHGGVWRGEAGEGYPRAPDNPWDPDPVDGAPDSAAETVRTPDVSADVPKPREGFLKPPESRDTAMETLQGDEILELDDLDFDGPGLGRTGRAGGEETRISRGSADSADAAADLDWVGADSETGLELDGLELSMDDRVAAKLDLAKAYMDLGDLEGAGSMLDEVLLEGNADQKKEAKQLISELNASFDQ